MNSNKHRVKVEIKVSSDPGTLVTFYSKGANRKQGLSIEGERPADPWFKSIEGYLTDKIEVSGLQLAVDCLKLAASDYTKSAQMGIARILRSLGWKRKQLWRNNRKINGWVPVNRPAPPTTHLIA